MEKYRSGEKALTLGQVQLLLSNPKLTIYDEALLRLAITGGLRRADLVETMKENFNSDMLDFVENKKGRRIHTIFLPLETVKVLNQLVEAYPKGPWLFPGANPRRHISGRTAYNILQRRLKEVGLPSRPIHALRATCIKLCQSRGWSAEQTAKHVNDRVQTIQEHYLTPSREEMAALAQEKAII